MPLKTKFLIFLIISAVLSCAIPLNQGAEVVQLIYIKPSNESCQFLGQTSASDGGMVSGDFMSDEKIHKNTAHIMKNKAYEMGGNIVYIQQQFNKNKKLTTNMTNQTMLGFVYYCEGLQYFYPTED